jgi:two-component system, chemotaxis family, sensor kinase CheA
LTDTDPKKLPFADFIDDYFVECDEHLGIARQSLLALEASVDQPQVDRGRLEELFRSFHSVKGLSAMVGVVEAEKLAHQMESYLSALRAERIRLTTGGLETLIGGVLMLERVIGARREHRPPPSVDALLAQFAALVRADRGAALPLATPAAAGKPMELDADKTRALAAALAHGKQVWRFTFVPAPELAARNVNVNAIRQRLQTIGDLIHAAPVVLPGTGIAFTFIVATQHPEATFVPWRTDALTYAPYAAPPPEPVAPSSATTSSLMPPNMVRVDLGRLDDLMRMVGELVISRARLAESLRRIESRVPGGEMRALHETNQAIERQLRDLREGVMRVRLVPVREIFARMQFVVRDLTREYGKKVSLTLSGQETEIDKLLVERMMDPLLHLVRNAVSHGLESAEERVRAGKSPEGSLMLRASTTGETIVIEVEDDGRGIDAAAVVERARGVGLVPADATSDSVVLLDILSAAGFSTRDEADRTSGRGVGMAVVRTVIEELGGSMSLETEPGVGTHFTIHLPLTLAIADALIVTVSGQTFAVPQVAVREVLQVEPANLRVLENNELIPYRAGVLPLVRLTAFFGHPEPPGGSFHTLVVGTGRNTVGLAVERVIGLREIVVRPLADVLLRVPGIAGVTELGDGRVVLILDAVPLARAARKQLRRGRTKSATESALLPV